MAILSSGTRGDSLVPLERIKITLESLRSERMINNSQVRELLERIAQAGGFTYHVVTREYAQDGYSVAGYPNREAKYSAVDFTPGDLEQYIIDNIDVLSLVNVWLGAWDDQGVIYLDCSIIVQSPSEADRLASEFLQLAYYDLANGQTIGVN